MANTLTDRAISAAKLPTNRVEHYISDGAGLYLRLREWKSGTSKSWVLRYLGRKLTLGAYPEVSLARARELAFDARKLIAEGTDPLDAKVQAAAAAHAAAVVAKLEDAPKTVSELGEKWLANYVKLNHKNPGYVANVFLVHIAPQLGAVPLQLLRARHVAVLLDGIAGGGKKRTAGVVLATLRQAIKWGVAREYLAGDCTSSLKSAAWGGAGGMRSRMLSIDEIKLLHQQLRDSTLAIRWQHAIWLILASGTRVTETLLAEVQHVDLQKKTWTIPAGNQKVTNRRTAATDHVVHLSAFALQHIAALRAAATGRYLFPSRAKYVQIAAETASKPCDNKTLTHLITNRQVAEPKSKKESTQLLLPGGKWTPHDLRRTLATQMGELDIAPNVIDKCLNHSAGSLVTRTYQHQKLQKQMAAAWELWGATLAEILADAGEPKIETPPHQPQNDS
jgi:integrase